MCAFDSIDSFDSIDLFELLDWFDSFDSIDSLDFVRFTSNYSLKCNLNENNGIIKCEIFGKISIAASPSSGLLK